MCSCTRQKDNDILYAGVVCDNYTKIESVNIRTDWNGKEQCDSYYSSIWNDTLCAFRSVDLKRLFANLYRVPQSNVLLQQVADSNTLFNVEIKGNGLLEDNIVDCLLSLFDLELSTQTAQTYITRLSIQSEKSLARFKAKGDSFEAITRQDEEFIHCDNVSLKDLSSSLSSLLDRRVICVDSTDLNRYNFRFSCSEEKLFGDLASMGLLLDSIQMADTIYVISENLHQEKKERKEIGVL